MRMQEGKSTAPGDALGCGVGYGADPSAQFLAVVCKLKRIENTFSVSAVLSDILQGVCTFRTVGFCFLLLIVEPRSRVLRMNPGDRFAERSSFWHGAQW